LASKGFYKQKELLARCLDSLQLQGFKDFEVIITDDTPDDSIADFVKAFKSDFPLHYYKNEIALGSPANWNMAISKASGKYIKIMHHDDWFAESHSLETFVATLDNNPTCRFAFSMYADVVNGRPMPPRPDIKQSLEIFRKNKSILLTYNFFGDPSTSIFYNNSGVWFDEKMKWCVDYDFYLQLLKDNSNIILIDEVLLHIGVHEAQITHTVIKDANVVVYENIRLLNKHGFKKLNLKQFDFFWRMMRNYGINSLEKLKLIAKDEPLPDYLVGMVKLQSRIPAFALHTGVLSKMFMVGSYLVR
jgi:glycosyltransferase involved in cell wall biosynthesis